MTMRLHFGNKVRFFCADIESECENGLYQNQILKECGDDMNINELQTPAILLNLDYMEHNIKKYAELTKIAAKGNNECGVDEKVL